MKPIAIPRPIDPELAALWDEAKRAVERRPIPLTIDDETRPIWECAKRAAAEVAAWPAWKHNELPKDDDCCVGDVTRCRCAAGAKQLAMSDEGVDREKWMAVWTDESEAM